MRVRLVLGTVAEQAADVLVRVAPRSLVGRVSDELLTAAGPEVRDSCRELRRLAFPGGVPVGEAVPTPAGQLPAHWLVHVVPPAFSIRADYSYLLAASYRACLRVADELSAPTVALAPLGSTPPYWPLDLMTRICLGTLYGTPTRVRQVRLVLSTPAALEIFAEAAARR